MKFKCNLFGLLSRGVTATHPLCSVFILSFVFVFLSFVVPANAASSNIGDMSDWQFSQAINSYLDLTDDQKDIANFITGSAGYSFAGMSNYNLKQNFSSYDDVIDYVKSYGSHLWDSFNSHVNSQVDSMLGRTNNLSNLLGNAVSYARSRSESFSAWLGNVGIEYNSSSEFRFKYGKDLSKDFRNIYGDVSLYDWQFKRLPLNEISNFVWDTYNGTPSASEVSKYHSNSVNFNYPCSVNYLSPYKSCIADISFAKPYHILFINSNTYQANLVNDLGQSQLNYPTTFNCNFVSYNSSGSYNGGSFSTYYNGTRTVSYTNVDAAVFQCFNDFAWYGSLFFNLSDVVDTILIGESFSTAVPWTYVNDLNIAPVSQFVTINSPSQPIYIDIVGFIKDLYDNPTTIINYVIDNSVDDNGNPVTTDIIDNIPSIYDLPLSGIHIGSDFFKLPSGLSLFDTYIADLWNNTKAMVLYCGDILDVFTLEGGGGISYILYGGIAVGVIGGIFSKFLL